MKEQTIILDANAFITGQKLLELAANNTLCTTSSVLQQIRDQKTRNMIDTFPFSIKKLTCSKKSLEIVRDFAKKTGDLSSLSDVDLEVIAVAYQAYCDQGKKQLLRSDKPLQMKEWKINEQEFSDGYEDSGEQESEGDVIKQQKEQEEANVQIKNDSKRKQSGQDSDDGWIVVGKNKNKKLQSSDQQMDDEQGWITPSNYDSKMTEINAKFSEETTNQPQQQEKKELSILVMTADFAMQNVCTQMSIPLLSLDGRQIKEIRRFIFECYLCWKRYKIQDNKVRLCKQCGYNSLSKIAYSINSKGEMILHRKKGWKPNQKVLEWKQKKYQQQQRKRKHQHQRRRKQPSIFDNV